jgi:AAA+ ATPase superfamily predicted ATPase
MKMFISRSKELAYLEDLIDKKRSSFVVVYGRRRIGKTEIIRHFISKNNLISLEITGVYGASRINQINSFVRNIKNSARNLNIENKIKDWQEVFFLLEDFILSFDSSEKKILFLDEFPWLDTPKSGFLEAFSYFWNAFCTKRDDIIVIVCGSAASYMIDRIVKNRKTLHGRVTQVLHMLPFDLNETKELLGKKGCIYSTKAIVQIFMAFGGVAKYLDDIDPSKSVNENIAKQCFGRNAILKNEYNDLFDSLFKNSKWHYAVMNLLANKWSGYTQKELLEKVGTIPAVIAKPLEELEHSGFITSTTKFGQVKRDTIFRATDSFSYFYNKWMKNQKDVIWENVVTSQSFISWTGFAFENICHLHINGIKKALGISGVSTKSHYWRYTPKTKEEKGAQIDILLEHTNGSKNIDIIECKFSSDEYVIDKRYFEDLKNKTSVFNRATKNRYNIRVIMVSVYGVAKNEYYNEIVNRELLIGDVINNSDNFH